MVQSRVGGEPLFLKNGTNSVCPLTGSDLFPQSIPSTKRKSQSAHLLTGNGSPPVSDNGSIVDGGNRIGKSSVSEREEDKHQSSANLINFDIYESSHYDMVFLKDAHDTVLLHCLDDKSEQGPLFNIGFEPLPEPFVFNLSIIKKKLFPSYNFPSIE